jgi:hypothetical protein
MFVRCSTAVTLLLLDLARPASASVCHYDNLMPAFLAFEQQTEDLPPERRAQLFADTFAPKYRDFYSELGRVEDGKGFPTSTRLRKDALGLLDPGHMESLPGFAPLTQAKFEAVARSTGPEFDHAQAAFSDTFPDFKCPAEITLGPSFLHFDGHVYFDKAGGRHMLFGVDALAVEHNQAEMPAIFAHELFHTYHREALGKAYPKDDGALWWSMWMEGLATYASQRLNPALSPQQVLGFPPDLVTRMQMPGVIQRAARLLLADLDTSNSAWFETTHTVSNLPPRTGYYMGYELAASLGRDHSLDWLAHLPPAQVKQEARKFLMSETR